MSGVTDKWTTEGERIMRDLRELAEMEVLVGFQRGKQHKKKGKTKKAQPDVLDIAMWNEFGAKKGKPGEIPERPFMRQTFDNHVEEIGSMQDAAYDRLMKGASPGEALRSLGVKVKGLMQNEIAEGGFTENAPATVKRKKSDVPLIDTGHMRQSVQFIVRKKGQGE